MGRRFWLAALAGLAVIALAGCYRERLSYRLAPPAEGLFGGAAVTAADNTFAATEAPAPAGQKVGRASAQSFLDLVATGSASAADAAKAGGVNRIQSADVEIIRVKALSIPVYTRYTVVVRGD